MQKSHVLINCESGTENIVSSEITKVEEVKSVTRTSGYYNLVVALESSSEEQLREIMDNRIRHMEPIHSTLTLIHA